MNRKDIKKKAKEFVNNKIWDFWKPLIVYYFLAMLIEFILLKFIEAGDYQSLIITTIVNILLLPVLVGVNKYHLCIIRNEEVSLDVLKNYFGDVLKLVGLYILVELLTFGGFIMFIIPGIIISLSLTYAIVIW